MDIMSLLKKLSVAIEYDQLAEQFAQVEGYLRPAEGFALMLLAKDGEGEGAVVEIGSYQGLSTCWIATGLKARGGEKVVAIDHFMGSPEQQAGEVAESQVLVEAGTTYGKFRENVAKFGLDDYVDARVASSEDAAAAWAGPIRLLFIDGDHPYEAVKTDFTLWTPSVVPGGYIALHDLTTAPGVTQLYREVMQANDKYTEIFKVGDLGVIRKEY